ncbi:hypothetical protein PTTG_25334 [Puccinia triticina 1-1 BBBD Race 1]|uniref:Uncharacterized protein n=1 Tax=Puccinia triticina (isolate 1-1 / race 1 (BBBD)) TaxID=630390 RepID=A0A180H390_PUCT1|nr:hypothetical protein PTTG_25334 [Puccinia triticina 1-1 BBBD Race 1]
METCSQTVAIGHGITCAHKISKIIKDGSSLMPDDFHDQWNLQYNPKFENQDKIELNLDEEIKKLTLALSKETPRRLETILGQIHQLVAGTHIFIPTQAPGVKKKPKGRPKTKKKVLMSTKRDPSSFEVVEAKLKKKELEKKRVVKSRKQPEQKSKQIKKDNVKEEPELSSSSPKESIQSKTSSKTSEQQEDERKPISPMKSKSSHPDKIPDEKEETTKTLKATHLEQIPVHL